MILILAFLGLFAQSPADETAIRTARERSNRALGAHDVDAAAAIWSIDYIGLSSANTRTVGREDERVHVAKIFSSRPDAVYVRTPTTVTVNAKWGQAAESGRWTGVWSQDGGTTRIGGMYFAKWKREGDTWRILSETFVQTTCSGTHYCDAPPP